MSAKTYDRCYVPNIYVASAWGGKYWPPLFYAAHAG